MWVYSGVGLITETTAEAPQANGSSDRQVRARYDKTVIQTRRVQTHSCYTIVPDVIGSPPLLAAPKQRVTATTPDPYWQSYNDATQADPAVPAPIPADLTAPTPYLLKHVRRQARDERPHASSRTTAEVDPPPLANTHRPGPHLSGGMRISTPAIPSTRARNAGPGMSSSRQPPPPSFRSNEETEDGAESRSTRFLSIIRGMRAQMDAVEPPPPYVAGSRGEGHRAPSIQD